MLIIYVVLIIIIFHNQSCIIMRNAHLFCQINVLLLLLKCSVCVGSGRARDEGWCDRWEVCGGWECALCIG